MKIKSKPLELFTLSCLMLFLAACGGKFSSPEKTTKGFYNAIAKGQYEEAFLYVDPAIQSQPGAKSKLIGLISSQVERDPIKSFKITDVDIDGDEAIVSLRIELDSGATENERISLIVQDGNWYIEL